MNFAHRLRSEVEAVGAAVNEVGVSQLRPAAQKHLRHLFPKGAHWLPGGALHLVTTGRRRDVTEAVAEQFIAPKRVLMPHLEMQLGPTCERWVFFKF